MTRLNLAEWAYLLGCAGAAASILFRALFFFGATGVNVCKLTGLKPSSVLQFSVLCLVVSLASRGW